MSLLKKLLEQYDPNKEFLDKQMTKDLDSEYNQEFLPNMEADLGFRSPSEDSEKELEKQQKDAKMTHLQKISEMSSGILDPQDVEDTNLFKNSPFTDYPKKDKKRMK